eukprot:1180299-Prorocentrum_minimum.AAC.3
MERASEAAWDILLSEEGIGKEIKEKVRICTLPAAVYFVTVLRLPFPLAKSNPHWLTFSY